MTGPLIPPPLAVPEIIPYNGKVKIALPTYKYATTDIELKVLNAWDDSLVATVGSNILTTTVDASLITKPASRDVGVKVIAVDKTSARANSSALTPVKTAVKPDWVYEFQIGTGVNEYVLGNRTDFTSIHTVPTLDEFYVSNAYKLFYLGRVGNLIATPVEVPKEGIDTFAATNPDGTWWINDDNGYIQFMNFTLSTKVYRLVKM